MEINNSGPFYAIANIKGGKNYPNIDGSVVFKKMDTGVLVTAEVYGLPYSEDKCDERIFAFHIHDGDSCTGNDEDEFANAGKHLNLEGCKHPSHSGDLPPLLGNNGYAYLSVYTSRFTLDDIIRKSNYNTR